MRVVVLGDGIVVGKRCDEGAVSATAGSVDGGKRLVFQHDHDDVVNLWPLRNRVGIVDGEEDECASENDGQDDQ